jgi:hypothetical protein
MDLLTRQKYKITMTKRQCLGTYHCDLVVIPACHSNGRVSDNISGNNAIASREPTDIFFEGGLSDSSIGSILNLVVNATVLLPVLDKHNGTKICCRRGHGVDIQCLSKWAVLR